MYCQNAMSLQKSLREWIEIDHWNYPFGITLTLKQRIDVDGEVYRSSVPLTLDMGSQNLRHFLNVLNKQIYGSSFTRYGKRLFVIPVLEGGGLKRLHYHVVVDCPRDELIGRFPSLITQTWRSTQWGYHQTVVEPCDRGWINYITKLRDKPDFGTSIDWLNYHNPN